MSTHQEHTSPDAAGDGHGHGPPPGEPVYWLDIKANQDKVFYAVVVVYVITILAGFLPYEHHPHFDFEVLPFFQGFYGLFCCIGLVLVAAWLRTFLMREEDYYDAE